MILLGLALAAASAATSQIGFLLRQRGAVAAPDVDVRHPLRSAIDLFRSRWWTIGYVVAAIAYGLHVAALGLASLSLVQAVLAGGLVLLALIAERFFGFELGKREWAGVALASIGLAFLALTGESGGGQETSNYSAPAMILFETVLVGIGVALILSGRVPRVEAQRGVLLGVSAGLLFTVTHVAVKAMMGKADAGLLEALASPFLVLAVGCAVAAFFASARSLQLGPAVPVIAMTSVASNASAIPAGIIVFGDPLGNDVLEIALRSTAFALVVFAAALIPAPTRAAGAARAAGRQAAHQQAASAQPAGG
jgi:drug/metabolite transporter (DMT)-like permease